MLQHLLEHICWDVGPTSLHGGVGTLPLPMGLGLAPQSRLQRLQWDVNSCFSFQNHSREIITKKVMERQKA